MNTIDDLPNFTTVTWLLTCPPPPVRLSTKLMKLVKDRGRMEKLAAGGAQPVSRVRDVEMEEMMEELQEKVRGLQAENEGLKQRLLVAKHQLINMQSKRPSPYRHVQSRVNTGLKKLPDDTSSPSQTRPRSEVQSLRLEEHRLDHCCFNVNRWYS